MPTLVIIDGNSFMHRAYHALPKTLKLPSGELINALYGFAAFLLHLFKTEKPDYLAITFDHKAPTVRHQEYSAYKATRVKAPDDFYAQIPLIKELIEKFNIKIFEMPGYESDDLIAALKQHLTPKDNLKTIIYTGDHDILQLVDEQTVVALPISGLKKVNYLDTQKIEEKYGLNPNQISDYKALRGDPSDNIPGVKGIGQKTATKLLKKYENIENLYAHLDQIDPKTREKLELNRENGFLSKKLATLISEIPLHLKLENLSTGEITWEKVLDFFQKFHFKSLISRIEDIAPQCKEIINKQMEMF